MSEIIDEDPSSWRAIVHRGQFTMMVFTRARAEQDSLLLHADAALIATLCPDGGMATEVNFLSCKDLQEFMLEMRPRSVQFMYTLFEALQFEALL